MTEDREHGHIQRELEERDMHSKREREKKKERERNRGRERLTGS